MARTVFRKEEIVMQTNKFSLALEDGSYNIDILLGEGVPTGTSEDSALSGSIYLDTTDGSGGLYFKNEDGPIGSWVRIMDYFTLSADGGAPAVVGGGGTLSLTGDTHRELQTSVSGANLSINNIGEWKRSVEDKDLITAPAPVIGNRYIVAANGGDWAAGAADDIAICVDNASLPADWEFDTPIEGFAVWVKDEDKVYIFSGAAWFDITSTLWQRIGTVLSPATADDSVEISRVSNEDILKLVYTGLDTDGPTLLFEHDSATPAATDKIGELLFSGNNATPAMTEFVRLRAYSEDLTPAGEDGGFGIEVKVGGAWERIWDCWENLVVINDSGNDVDTRIEGLNDTRLFFVDASGDRIGISTAAAPSALFEIDGDDTTTKSTLYAHRNLADVNTDDAVVVVAQENAGDSQVALSVTSAGTSGGALYAEALAGGWAIYGSGPSQFNGDVNVLEKITTKNLEITGSNVTYLDIGDDLNVAIAAATVGDTLVLAAGPYAITVDTDVNKAISIVGQGKGVTVITSATDGVKVFNITASTVNIRDLTVDVTASNPYGFYINGSAGTNLTNIFIQDVEILLNSHTGQQRGIYCLCANAEIRDTTIGVHSTDNSAAGLFYMGNASSEATTTVNCHNVKSVVSTSAGTGRGFYCFDNTTASDVVLNLYNCSATVTEPGGAPVTYGIEVEDTQAYVFADNCVISGENEDVANTINGNIELRDCTLINGTTVGTVTFAGTNVNDNLLLSGNLISSDYIALENNSELRFHDNGNYVGFEAPALIADQIWVLPDADGNIGESLQTDGAGNLSWAPALGVFTKVITIGPTGCDYTAIQTALTNNVTADTLFLVYPDTYVNDTINFTASNQVVRGVGVWPGFSVVTNTAQICNFGAHTGCKVCELKLLATYTAAIDMITGTGSCNFYRCHLECNGTGTYANGSTILATTGTVQIVKGSIISANDVVAGASYKRAVTLGAGCSVELRQVQITVVGTGASTAHAVVLSESTGGAIINRCSVNMTDNVSGITVGMAVINGRGTSESAYNDIHVSNSSNDAIALYLDSDGNALDFRSMFNHIHCVAGGNAYSHLTANDANVILKVQLDDVIAVNGISQGAASTIEWVYSPADGDIDISGDITIGGVLADAFDMGSQSLTNVNIDSGVITGITDLTVADGGTGASTAANARTNLTAAKSGVNSDITELTTVSGDIKGGVNMIEMDDGFPVHGDVPGSGEIVFQGSQLGSLYAHGYESHVRWLAGTCFSSFSEYTVANSVVEKIVGVTDDLWVVSTDFLGSKICPANFWKVGRKVRVTVGGLYTTKVGAADTLTVRCKVGTTTLVTLLTGRLEESLTDEPWQATCDLTCWKIGDAVTGEIDAQGWLGCAGMGPSGFTIFDATVAAINVNTEIAQEIQITLQHSEADAGNIFDLRTYTVEILN